MEGPALSRLQISFYFSSPVASGIHTQIPREIGISIMKSQNFKRSQVCQMSKVCNRTISAATSPGLEKRASAATTIVVLSSFIRGRHILRRKHVPHRQRLHPDLHMQSFYPRCLDTRLPTHLFLELGRSNVVLHREVKPQNCLVNIR